MRRPLHDITAGAVLAAYEAVVSLADLDLADEARKMRERFEARTGAFGPDDPWFEARSRAFWDDALTGQGFAALAAPRATADVASVIGSFDRAHRGIFLVEEVDDEGALLADLWSGAELRVRHLDEAQAVTLEHADGAMDARVVAGPLPSAGTADLYVLPGAFHHGSDATTPILEVIAAARARDMSTEEALDALLRMELVFRSSSRVKTGFAYRAASLSPRPSRPVL